MQLPLKAVFEAQTVAEMAEVVNVGLLIRNRPSASEASARDYEIIDLRHWWSGHALRGETPAQVAGIALARSRR